MAEIPEVLERVKDLYDVKRVYAEPVVGEGVTVIPAARVSGGGGGGGGVSHGENEPAGEGEGSGMGFGMNAKPAGAWIIRGDDVTWRPALDVNRIVVGGELVAIAMFLFGWLASRNRMTR